jgi:hypothetical protein
MNLNQIKLKFVCNFLILFGFQLTYGAINSKGLSEKENFKTVQRQIGGQAGSGFSIINVQKVQSKNGKVERLIFEIGTKDGFILKGKPGYFNVQNQVKSNQIVVDFSQMFQSKVNEDFLRGIIKDSKVIKSAKLTQDPQDKTLSMVLKLKAPVKMRTLQVEGKKKTALVVIDMIQK